jgi:Rod binding domain-containing protein
MSDFRIANLGGNSASFALAKSDHALQGLANKATKSSPSKIDKAAHEFESILVGQWLEKAEKSFGSVPGSHPDQDNDSSHDQFQSLACESMAKTLTKGKGFGIATMIIKHLSAVDPSQTAPATPKLGMGGAIHVTVGDAKSIKDK